MTIVIEVINTLVTNTEGTYIQPLHSELMEKMRKIEEELCIEAESGENRRTSLSNFV